MRKMICSAIILAVLASVVFPAGVFADSPLTSTEFYTAYLDVELVAKAREMGHIDEEMAQYLSDPANPLDIKAAVINAIGWGKPGNTERYASLILGKTLDDLDLDVIPPHDLFCIGYLMAMEYYGDVGFTPYILEKASLKLPDSFTVTMITALVKGQVALKDVNEWYKVWEYADEVVSDQNLVRDMRDEAVEIIMDYIALYKDYFDYGKPKPITLTYFRSPKDEAEDLVKGYIAERFYNKLEEKTNIKIDFIITPEDIQMEKLMLMVAAGEIPDFIEFPWQKYPGLLEKMAEMGVIIELSDLINNYAPHVRHVIETNTEMMNQIRAFRDHIYQVPVINIQETLVGTGPVIREDLLKKYWLNVPETIKDWENVLKVFKDAEPSVKPLTFSLSMLKESNVFISAFGIPYGFGVRDGKVFYGPVEDSYREFLSTLSRWYKNELIDPEFLVLQDSQIKAKVNDGKVAAFIGSVDDMKNSSYALKSVDSSFELVPARNPVLYDRDKLNMLSEIPISTESGIAIGSKNVYPRESVQWIEQAYIEAVNPWSLNTREQVQFKLPPVTFTEEESSELSAIMSNLSVYTDERFARYVIGDESLDSFEDYVMKAKKLGVDRAVEIMQAALDRYNNRMPILEINGLVVETDTDPMIIIGGEMLLPVRFVVEGLGGSVAWHAGNRMITAMLGDTVLSLRAGSTEVLINYVLTTLNRKVEIINRRAYVPVWFIEETFDVDVSYDESTRTVKVVKK